MKNFARLVVIFTLVGCVVGWFIGRANPPKKEREKLSQHIGPLRYELVEVGMVLQGVVDSAEIPISIGVCREILLAKITVKMKGAMSLAQVLEGISLQVDGSLSLYGGNHGEIARPIFWCVGEKGPLVTIAKGIPR